MESIESIESSDTTGNRLFRKPLTFDESFLGNWTIVKQSLSSNTHSSSLLFPKNPKPKQNQKFFKKYEVKSCVPFFEQIVKGVISKLLDLDKVVR